LSTSFSLEIDHLFQSFSRDHLMPLTVDSFWQFTSIELQLKDSFLIAIVLINGVLN
jgi:succinate dehydrogenase flavin-adding protein (antitoxin of CptAB toxin-antitoxin module)